jgi:hypothetical protein
LSQRNGNHWSISQKLKFGESLIGKKRPGAVSVPPRFVAGFLLLRITWKSYRNSGGKKHRAGEIRGVAGYWQFAAPQPDIGP